MLRAEAIEGTLGYRGFVISAEDVEAANAKFPKIFRIGGTISSELASNKDFAINVEDVKESADVARWLLSTAGNAVDEELKKYVEGAVAVSGGVLERPKEPISDQFVEPIATAGCTFQNPAFNPSFWNTPQAQPHNNCYNYAMNYQSNTFAQPGRISGHQCSTMTCTNVAAAANWDRCTETCSGATKLVALVIWPGRDYHWYAKHSNDFWGHKPGQTPARNTDNSGRIISGNLNPQNCNRGPYTSFCGYRYSPVGMHVN